jgi:2-oxo-4-hydroxy-4-carboxy-5-ureidoimidazoline decarboxylase
VERMAAGRPYADVEALLGESDRAVEALGRDDLAEALAGHPRIGQRADGSSAEELRQVTRRRLEGLLRP